MLSFTRKKNLFSFTSHFKDRPLKDLTAEDIAIYTACSSAPTEEEKNICVKGFMAGVQYSAEQIASQNKNFALPH